MRGNQPRLRDQVRAVIRVNHYSVRIEKSYWYWIRYFIRFHQMTHPRDMGPREVKEFLTWLAVNRNVAGATQAQGHRRNKEHPRNIPRNTSGTPQ